jgi:hypothetical protein
MTLMTPKPVCTARARDVDKRVSRHKRHALQWSRKRSLAHAQKQNLRTVTQDGREKAGRQFQTMQAHELRLRSRPKRRTLLC